MSPKKPNLNKQQEVLETVVDYVVENGYSPSIREVAASANISSSSAHYYLGQLADANLLTWTEGKQRTVRPTEEVFREMTKEELL